MPSSRASTIPYVIYAVKQVQPESILDVGVGFGKWGYLFREYTDVIKSERNPRRYDKTGWKIRIEGIEAHRPYLHQGHEFIYDKIHIGNAEEILPNLGKFDFIFFGDIIEHFPIETGGKLLRTAMSHANKCVMLTTPKFDTGQSDSGNNPLEQHRSVWTPKDFHTLGECLMKLADKSTYVVAYPGTLCKDFKLRIEHGSPEPAWVTFIKDRLRPIKRRLSKTWPVSP